MAVTLGRQADGRTALTPRQLHPGRTQREQTIGFRAVSYGVHTFDKFAAHLATLRDSGN
jgi:hypothetical protein